MSGAKGGALRALWPALPLLVWGLHFAGVYASHALACERGLGAGFVGGAVAVATALALLALLALARPGLAALRADADGGEAEGGFARWFAAAAALAAGLAVLFQTSPALLVPPCG